jgi:hypothetical protein
MSMMDYFYLLVVILILGMSIIIGVYLKDAIFPQLSNAFSSSPAATSALTTVSNSFSIFDEIFLLIFVLMSIVPIVFAFLVPSNPVFVFVNIILIAIYLLIAPTISNMMRSFLSSSIFASYATGGTGSATFPIMTAIFEYLPIITCGLSFVLMVVLFGKSGGGGM